MNLAYPYAFGSDGRTGQATDSRHVRDLIEQILFTAPGERVMLPDFGSSAARLVFAPNGAELAAATQMLVQASLQRWLGDLITVQGVAVSADDATLNITVQYLLRGGDQLQQQTFQRPVGGAS